MTLYNSKLARKIHGGAWALCKSTGWHPISVRRFRDYQSPKYARPARIIQTEQYTPAQTDMARLVFVTMSAVAAFTVGIVSAVASVYFSVWMMRAGRAYFGFW